MCILYRTHQESSQREQYESLRGFAVPCVSHEEEGHSNISCISLNMRAFVIPHLHRLPQSELCQGKKLHRGSMTEKLGTQRGRGQKRDRTGIKLT